MAVEILCWVNFFRVTATKAYAGMEVHRKTFFSTSLVWSGSLLVHHTPGVTALGTHWIAGLLDPKAVLNKLMERKMACFFQESNQYSSVAKPLA